MIHGFALESGPRLWCTAPHRIQPSVRVISALTGHHWHLPVASCSQKLLLWLCHSQNGSGKITRERKRGNVKAHEDSFQFHKYTSVLLWITKLLMKHEESIKRGIFKGPRFFTLFSWHSWDNPYIWSQGTAQMASEKSQDWSERSGHTLGSYVRADIAARTPVMAKCTEYNDSQLVSKHCARLFCLSSALPLAIGVIVKANKEQLSLVMEAHRAELETMATQCLPL